MRNRQPDHDRVSARVALAEGLSIGAFASLVIGILLLLGNWFL